MFDRILHYIALMLLIILDKNLLKVIKIRHHNKAPEIPSADDTAQKNEVFH